MIDDSKIFIVGANGQLGTALRVKYPNANNADIDELNITNKDSVECFNWSNIDVIINAAAFTNVDAAETSEGRIAAWDVNASAVSYLSSVAKKHNSILIHVSTDYVFDGAKEIHDENEPFSPLSVYGASKAAGDIAAQAHEKHYILRTSWVIGEGKNFVITMLNVGKRGISPSVVSDQVGRLTFTNELVCAVDHLLTTRAPYGTYNVSNSGDQASWADIAREIFQLSGYNLEVSDVTTENYFRGKEGIAPRPLQSTLDLTKITSTGLQPNDWKTSLKEYIAKETT